MKQEFTAFMLESLPCNPIPFAQALINGVKENCHDWIKSDEAKSLLHLLNQMAYGQLYTIDSVNEFNRLFAVFKDRMNKP